MKKIYEKLYDLLTEWNAKFNLTAIKSRENFEVKHIKDSMLGLPFISGRTLDIGSGAGFPGLVIKIEKPETEITLVDSVRKKTEYLKAAVAALGLTGVTVVHSRIEDLPGKGTYDTVTARAVAPMRTLAEYCLPFVKTGGAAVAYKSENAEDEIKEAERAIAVLGGRIERDELLELDGDTRRRILVVRKIKETPAAYPRKGNKPRLSPL